MSDLQLFQNPEFGRVRIVEVSGEAWMVGKDVAEALGYAKAQNAIAAHVDEEDRKVAPIQGTPGGTQEMTIINESGLYSLVLSSKLPNARKFRRWVTTEVLHTVRRHGAYMTPETLQAAILNPDTMIQLCQQLKAEREHSRQLEAENAAMLPKAVFADAVSASKSSILVGELAKLLRQNGVDTGEKRLFHWLRQNGYLIKRNGADHVRKIDCRAEKLFETDSTRQNYRKQKSDGQSQDSTDKPDLQHVGKGGQVGGASKYPRIISQPVEAPFRHARRDTVNGEKAHNDCSYDRIQIHDEQGQRTGQYKARNHSFIFFHIVSPLSIKRDGTVLVPPLHFIRQS